MAKTRTLNHHNTIEDVPLGLLTDLYQLTMAAGYWRSGMAQRHGVFHLFFRRHPFGGAYALAAGLEQVLDLLERWRFSPEDLEYLAGLVGNDGKPLLPQGFLEHLAELRFTGDLDAVPEGTVVFAHEPLLRFHGPILQGQLLETAWLNILNFQTLVATKASRIVRAAAGDPVLEFGLRRSQGPDGGLSAGRAAYVGGCVGTSNVLAGRRFGIPVRGTHAHSWVMAFGDEREAFAAYAEALPNNCIFLVDTFDTLEGVRRAIVEAKKLRQRGHEMVGIRLDSGDLLTLSREARRLLDAAGFPEAKVVASNDLDEYRIARLKADGAAIDIWGVGTRLATAYDQPALGGVYKLTAVRDGDDWRDALKLSEDPVKIPNPGIQQVRRFRRGGRFVGDVIHHDPRVDASPGEAVGPSGFTAEGVEQTLDAGAAGEWTSEPLLVPVTRGGEVVYDVPSLDAVRQRAFEQLGGLDPSVLAFEEPSSYPVLLDPQLHQVKQTLIARAQEETPCD